MAINFRADKNLPLTYSEMDNNFGSYFHSASVTNTSVTLFYPSSSEVPVNSGSVQFSLVKGLQQTGGNRKIAFSFINAHSFGTNAHCVWVGEEADYCR